jgi:thiamine biosynthesis lipoprotein
MIPDFSKDVIGTHIDIFCIEWSEGQKKELCSNIDLRLTRFEKKYSRFIRGNWLDQVNIDRIWMLDEDGMYMLQVALQVAKNTNGYFDPTITSQLSNLWYGREDHKNHGIGWESISLNTESSLVELKNNVLLEFWWVGKWYLIDIIQEIIEEYIETNNLPKPKYLINFWWDMYGIGGWKIGLENPNNFEEAVGIIELHWMYLACSSWSRRKWNNHHHLIDPHTGESANQVQATFIEWHSGIMTDAYATAFAVMPFSLACTVLESIPKIEWVILSNTWKFFQSSGSKSKLFTQ